MEEMLQKLRQMGITDERVLKAITRVDRKLFVPNHLQDLAYADQALPLGFNQTISQPYTVARMLELLIENGELRIENSKVLEIGTGSGWQTALLTYLFEQIYSVELIPELAREAKLRIENLELRNVRIKTGDGRKGWPKYSPYEAIICGADADEIPNAWKKQLADGGRIVCPVKGRMIRVIKQLSDGVIKYEEEIFGRYDFVPLV